MRIEYALCDQDCPLKNECGGHVLAHQPLDPEQEILGKNSYVTLNENCFYRRPWPVPIQTELALPEPVALLAP